MRILCLEEECLCSNPIIKLSYPNRLLQYCDHLRMHIRRNPNSRFSILMLQRIEASDVMYTMEMIEGLGPPPYSALPETNINLSASIEQEIINLTVIRDFEGSYMGKWISVLIDCNVMNSQNVLVQQFDALIMCILSHPNPMNDWKIYKNLVLFALALFVTTTEAGYNLYRGDFCKLSLYGVRPVT